MTELLISSISKYEQEYLKKVFCSDNISWYYNPTTILNSKLNRPQLTHSLYKNNQICSEYFSPVYEIFSKYIPEFQTHRLNRIKANLNFAHSNRKILPPHTDLSGGEGIVYIYYIEDSDGPTILYPSRFRKIKVNPEQGKLIRFPATTLHSGNVPRKYSRRSVINFVFES